MQQTIVPAQVQPPIETPMRGEDDAKYPAVLPARSLTIEEIGDVRVKVDAVDIEKYRQKPDYLPDQIFVSASSGEIEAFRVSAILTTEAKEKLYYLVFAGDGPEAYGHSSKDFFDILSSSYRVV